MRRNKPVKRTTKRQTATNPSRNIQNMEKDFLQIPAKIGKHIDKELNAHKKREHKLHKAIQKLQSQLNKSENRIHKANGKREFVAAKKLHDQNVKQHAELNKQWQEAVKNGEQLSNSQSKWSALAKHLTQFDKDWTKNAKKAKQDAKPKTYKMQKPKDANTAVEKPRFETVDNTTDNTMTEEVTELAS